MGRAVAIGRLDLAAEGLRSAASVEKDGAAARRILALALVLEGEAARGKVQAGIALVRSPRSSFKCLLGRRIAFGMLRAHGQTAVTVDARILPTERS